MFDLTKLATLAVALAVTPLAFAADPAKKLTADEVVKQWTPKAKDVAMLGGGPKGTTDVAGWTFSLKGTSLDEVWNFFADKCGLEERYKEKNFLISGKATKAGECVVSGRPANGTTGHGESMFLLKTAEYTVVVSFHLDPDGKTILGSIAVVVK